MPAHWRQGDRLDELPVDEGGENPGFNQDLPRSQRASKRAANKSVETAADRQTKTDGLA
ncbi:hypothetical protein [Rhodopirellula halodulae]|uniref:hypothetical protein n=1 Tax=Rhodopirellula halodulae TaxID=2894198 RepID=UPI001E2C13CD|nr:hypothetical protein [Rhodopirellula sp. JC740]